MKEGKENFTNGGKTTQRFRDELRERKELAMTIKCVLLDTELSPTARVLFTNILNLTFKYDFCYASNERLGELVGGCETTYKKAFKVLKDRELIIVKMETEDNYTKRKIYINYIEIFSKYLRDDATNKENDETEDKKPISAIRQKYKNLSNK